MSNNCTVSTGLSQSESISTKGEFTEVHVSLLLLTLVEKIIAGFNLTEADEDKWETIVSQHDSYHSALLHMIEEKQGIPANFWFIILMSAKFSWDGISSTDIDNDLVVFDLDTSFQEGKEKTTIKILFELLVQLKKIEEKQMHKY